VGERNQLLIAWADEKDIPIANESGYAFFTGNATNTSQFRNDFLLSIVGYRSSTSPTAAVTDKGSYGIFWSSTSGRSLHFTSSNVKSHNNASNSNGYALRCFKNTTVSTPLEGVVSYSTTDLTNQDVLVTLTLNKTGSVLSA
jgi:hypothetical protein